MCPQAMTNYTADRLTIMQTETASASELKSAATHARGCLSSNGLNQVKCDFATNVQIHDKQTTVTSSGINIKLVHNYSKFRLTPKIKTHLRGCSPQWKVARDV